MINFEPNTTSTLYQQNKTFAESINTAFHQFNAEVTGYCNSFGYELEAKFIHNDHNYTLKFTKNQSTQNGVVWPVDASDFCGLEVKISGISHEGILHVGKSKFKRFFTSARLKSMIPAPYFIKVAIQSMGLVWKI